MLIMFSISYINPLGGSDILPIFSILASIAFTDIAKDKMIARLNK